MLEDMQEEKKLEEEKLKEQLEKQKAETEILEKQIEALVNQTETLKEQTKEITEKEKVTQEVWRVSTGRKRQRKKQEHLRPLVAVEPEGINALGSQQEWEILELAVDSGATETVVNEDNIESVNTQPGMASKRGVKYEVANGVRIPNLGEKKFVAVSEEGSQRNITAQVCDVSKPLLSVKKVVDAGNRVVFDKGGSYIEDVKTGERMWMHEDHGMYMLKMYVRNASFQRQGK
jgi:predicted RNase H-like nuclease (RuvC/YqgF family)